MTRWMKLLVAGAALGALPAFAADTSAQAKDRKHENQIHRRMKERKSEKVTGTGARVNEGADQTADATRAGGARAARAYHGMVHSGKKASHKAAKKTSDATK